MVRDALARYRPAFVEEGPFTPADEARYLEDLVKDSFSYQKTETHADIGKVPILEERRLNLQLLRNYGFMIFMYLMVGWGFRKDIYNFLFGSVINEASLRVELPAYLDIQQIIFSGTLVLAIIAAVAAFYGLRHLLRDRSVYVRRGVAGLVAAVMLGLSPTVAHLASQMPDWLARPAAVQVQPPSAPTSPAEKAPPATKGPVQPQHAAKAGISTPGGARKALLAAFFASLLLGCVSCGTFKGTTPPRNPTIDSNINRGYWNQWRENLLKKPSVPPQRPRRTPTPHAARAGIEPEKPEARPAAEGPQPPRAKDRRIANTAIAIAALLVSIFGRRTARKSDKEFILGVRDDVSEFTINQLRNHIERGGRFGLTKRCRIVKVVKVREDESFRLTEEGERNLAAAAEKEGLPVIYLGYDVSAGLISISPDRRARFNWAIDTFLAEAAFRRFLAAHPEIIIRLDTIVIRDKNRAGLITLLNEIEKLLPDIEKLDVMKILDAMAQKDEAKTKITRAKPKLERLVNGRKHAIAGTYNAKVEKAEEKMENNPSVAVTTETIAMSDPYTFDNAGESMKRNITNYLVYGDIFKTRGEAENFVTASGGDLKDVELIDRKEFPAYEAMMKEIERREELKGRKVAGRIGLRASDEELRAILKGEKPSGVVLAVQKVEGTDIYAAIDSYQTLLEAMARAGKGIALDSIALPGLELDRIRGIFRYLPKALPIDYGEEIARYQTAVKLIQSAA
jgi:hypothetical protein